MSIGALGVLSTVTLQCVPAFTLAADERPMALDEVLARFGEFAAGNDHFEFYWFPYGKNALVKRNNSIDGADGPGADARVAAVLRVRGDGERRLRRAVQDRDGRCPRRSSR